MTDKLRELAQHLRHGVAPAMATPLEPGGYKVNLNAASELVEFLIDRHVNGLFVGGTTGEGILLSKEEREKLHAQAVEVAQRRVPILVHVGSATTMESIRLAEHAASIGADAIVAVTPYFYPASDAALLDYYTAIANAAPEIPLFAYSIPHMAVNTVSPSLLEKLAASISLFAGIKTSAKDAHEVRASINALADSHLVLAGNERLALGLLSIGADGLISGLSTAIPEPFVALTKAFHQGDLVEAERQHQIINKLLDIIPAGSRIGAIKSVISQRGIDAGSPVPPRTAIPDDWQGWSQAARILDLL